MTPNILIINCDDLGYGDLGCYGSTKNRTPYIDSLARGGLRLTDHYVMSPICSASRAALLTGCYPQRIGFGHHSVLLPGNNVGLAPTETTLAKMLKTGGYATKIVGKWHCGDQPEFLPTRHGFDSYFGIPYSNDMGLQSNRPAADRYCPLPLMRDETVIQEQPDQRGITERYTDEAIQFINQNANTPFFLYLPHMYVHVPLFVPKEFLARSQNGGYGAAVECIDWSTGVLIERLKELGLFENTILIFTSDNGARAHDGSYPRDEGGSNAPCRGTKGTCWEGGQRVPCLIHWPKKIASGGVWNGLSRSVDLLPTLARFAELNQLPELPIDGLDLSEQYLGKSEHSPNNVMAYYLWHQLEAIRVGDWKLHFAHHVHRSREPRNLCKELYNLRDDVGETQNVYDQHPEIVQRLQSVAEEFRKKFGDDLTGQEGTECRKIGQVENGQRLTTYREGYPYVIAEYDLTDSPTMAG